MIGLARKNLPGCFRYAGIFDQRTKKYFPIRYSSSKYWIFGLIRLSAIDKLTSEAGFEGEPMRGR